MNNSNALLLAMNTTTIVLLIILGVVIILAVVLYFLGKRLEKKQNEQKQMMEANKQTVSMLIIDKKKMKFKDAGFPQTVLEQIPKLQRGMKVPVVKAKVGPQMMTLFCDDKIFDTVPVKKEVKAVVSGMYIVDVKGLHGKVEVAPAKKKNFFKRAMDKFQEKTGAK